MTQVTKVNIHMLFTKSQFFSIFKIVFTMPENESLDNTYSEKLNIIL